MELNLNEVFGRTVSVSEDCGYLANREMLLKDIPNMARDRRYFHLGIDVDAEPGDALFAPFDAEIYMAEYEPGKGNYGGMIVLKSGGHFVLFGHLDPKSLLPVGTQIRKGEKFAEVGDRSCNGDWWPHVHIQVITQKGLDDGWLSKGYCTAEQIQLMAELCPNPTQFFPQNYDHISTKMIVDVEAIRSNLAEVQKFVGPDMLVMPIAKANAYGAGIEIAGQAFIDSKIIGVANFVDALKLQNICKDSVIFLMYQAALSDIDFILRHNFHLAVCEMEFLQQLNTANQSGNPIHVHIYVDTGHGVQGVPLDELEQFCQEIKTLQNIKVVGVFSHFTYATVTTDWARRTCKSQIKKCSRAFEIAESILGPLEFKHISNSGGIRFKNHGANTMRIGRLLYGLTQELCDNTKVNIRPALKYISKIDTIKKHKAGTTIGYDEGHKFLRDSTIACVACGYFDGLSYRLVGRGSFVINGQRAPIIAMTMNLCSIDITDIKGEIDLNTEVALFDNEVNTIDDVASWSGVHSYATLIQLGARVLHVAKS